MWKLNASLKSFLNRKLNYDHQTNLVDGLSLQKEYFAFIILIAIHIFSMLIFLVEIIAFKVNQKNYLKN